MNDNTLTEFMKVGIEFANSAVSAIAGSVISTLFLRKNTSITEFEKIKAGKFSEVIDKLVDTGKMSYLEYFKCKNFLTIAQKADEMLKEEKKMGEKQSYDYDWFLRFFEYASNISNEEMQMIWAKVLAGEIQNPNTTSMTLLHTLFMMRQEQAQAFYNVSRFALMDGADAYAHLLIFVSSNRLSYEKENITPTILKELERLGLLECNFDDEYVFLNKKILKTGNKIITIYGDPDNCGKIKAGNVKFTRDGNLLYTALDSEAKRYRSDILDYTITKFQRRNCRVMINDKIVL